MTYKEFLEAKIIIAESYGFDVHPEGLSSILFPHQRDICKWMSEGGRRACFGNFGLGKTLMQLELALQVIAHTGKPFLIGLPLGVIGEFKRDNNLLNTGFEVEYITDTDTIQNYEPKIYLTNYERIRKGDIDATKFAGVSFDEASILRNLKTETTNFVLEYFTKVPYRFVFTATPTPNNYIEILNYAVFLGVVDRGHALTRFFQRDSTKAGKLTLYENKKEEFWKWVSTWAVFINKPSDLGHDDHGYNLPKLNIHEVEVEHLPDEVILNKEGKPILFKDVTKSLVDTSREKSASIDLRVAKAMEIIDRNPYIRYIVWHHREAERSALEKALNQRPHITYKSVYGAQDNTTKERLITDFADGKYQILLSKPVIAGQGCNFQHDCWTSIFLGIDYKFNDTIQAVHRNYRFGQTHDVDCYFIHTQNEREVLKVLFEKWRKHVELQTEMINLVREYGLNTEKITSDMKRQLFKDRRQSTIGDVTVYNEDTTIIHKEMESDSTGMILTSIPFGDHYEYSDNYNDFGHNHGNGAFFEQMDYLTPELYRTLKPGRIAAIHVKDRIRYSHQTRECFTSIEDFSADVSHHFRNHGFKLMGKITVTTDVVRENNQTYRLGHSEQCKDASKMGAGMPEYIYIFRKPPTDKNNSYGDVPVLKGRDMDDRYCLNCNKPVHLKRSKESKTLDGTRVCKTCNKSDFKIFNELYHLDRWQLDAHAYWKSDGNRFLSYDELAKSNMKSVFNAWRKHDKTSIYNFQEHLRVCEDLEKLGKLSKEFMTIPPTSGNDMVWTDINRMNTLNANQVNRKKEKHICPLQLDIIERLINRYTMEGDLVDDPFGGLFSTMYKCLEMKRKGVSAELNPEYYDDGLFYLKGMEYKINVPTLFDLVG